METAHEISHSEQECYYPCVGVYGHCSGVYGHCSAVQLNFASPGPIRMSHITMLLWVCLAMAKPHIVIHTGG